MNQSVCEVVVCDGDVVHEADVYNEFDICEIAVCKEVIICDGDAVRMSKMGHERSEKLLSTGLLSTRWLFMSQSVCEAYVYNKVAICEVAVGNEVVICDEDAVSVEDGEWKIKEVAVNRVAVYDGVDVNEAEVYRAAVYKVVVYESECL